MNKRILITESDISLSTILSDYLGSQGWGTIVHQPDADTVHRILLGEYDLLLLSSNQTLLSVYELLSRMRQAECTTPVVILSDAASKDDILRAFECGCDDYVPKPFSIEILVCRIRAIIRRSNPALNESSEKVFRLGHLVFNSTKQTLGNAHLSARESELLLLLCRRQGTIVNKNYILRRLWQADDPFVARSLSVFIHRLRTRLDSTGVQIMPVRGKGYKLVINEP